MDNFHFLKEVTKDIEPEGFAVSSVPADGRQVAFNPVVFTLFCTFAAYSLKIHKNAFIPKNHKTINLNKQHITSDAKTKYTLLGLIVILIWATSASIVKQMVIFSNNNYLTDIVVYNALAFLVLLPIVLKRGEFKVLKDRKVLKALIPAVLCNGFYDLFITSAEGMADRIQYAQIGNYLWPMLIVLLLGIKKRNPSKAGIFSSLVGFLAVLVLFVPEVMGGGTMNSKDVWALLLGVAAAFLWASYSVILGTHEELKSSVYLIPALGQGVSSLVMLIFATSCGKFNLGDIANVPAMTCIVIYAVIGMSLSYVLWAFVMTKHPALENFSVFSYLTPILALLTTTLYFRGTFNIQILIAGILIVIAIYISKMR